MSARFSRCPPRALALLGAMLLCLAAALTASHAQAPADSDRQQRRLVLRFLTTDDFPPFNFKDEDGQLTGFNVDLARAICLELNVPCTVGDRPWPDLLGALTRRQADAVIAGHIVTSQALAQADFSDRYFHIPGRFAGRRDGPKLEHTPDGLDGRRVGVARASTHEAFLQAFFRDTSLERFETPELARDALIAGKVDAIFDDGVSLSMWINGTLSRECCEFKGGPFMEPRFFGDGMAIALVKNDRQLRADLNSALRKLRANGRFEELVLRYFPHRVF